MKNLKKFFELLITTAMVLSMAVVSAYAADTYDSETHTLTLEDATIAPVNYTETEDLTIILKGNNIIEGPANYAINAGSANVIIKGDGTLTANNMQTFISAGSITIFEKAKLISKNTTPSDYTAIAATSKSATFTMGNEAELTLDGYYNGIYVSAEVGENPVLFNDDVKVDIKATNIGIYSSRDMIFHLSENGQVKAQADTYPIAIVAGFNFTLADHNIVLEPENATQSSTSDYNFFLTQTSTLPQTVIIAYEPIEEEPTKDNQEEKTIVNTGDNAPITLVAIIAALSSLLLATTTVVTRKTSKEIK